MLNAYTGPSAPSLTGAIGSWTADPAALVLAAAAGSAYLVALGGARRAASRWPVRRVVLFFGGLAVLLTATCGWVGVYTPVLVSAFAVHVLLLLLVAPVFLVLGQPVSVARAAGWPTPARTARLLRRLTNPMASLLLVPLMLTGVFFSAVLPLSLQHAPVRHLLDIGLLTVGLLVAAPLVADRTDMPVLAIAAAMLAGFVELLLDAVPGMVLRLRTHLLAPGYVLGLHRPWGPSPLQDQRIAGAIVWSVAEVLDLPVLVLLAVRLVRADRRHAQAVDRRLDSAARMLTGTDSADREPARDRPWWETETGVFTGSRAARLRAPSGNSQMP